MATEFVDTIAESHLKKKIQKGTRRRFRSVRSKIKIQFSTKNKQSAITSNNRKNCSDVAIIKTAAAAAAAGSGW